MPDGHIRAYDSRKMSGISEAHIFTPPNIAPTILTKADHIKLMITDGRVNTAIQEAAKGL